MFYSEKEKTLIITNSPDDWGVLKNYQPQTIVIDEDAEITNADFKKYIVPLTRNHNYGDMSKALMFVPTEAIALALRTPDAGYKPVV